MFDSLYLAKTITYRPGVYKAELHGRLYGIPFQYYFETIAHVLLA